MRQRRFNRVYRKAIRRMVRNNDITTDFYDTCVLQLRSVDKMAEIKVRFDLESQASEGIFTDVDWKSWFELFVTYLLPALKIIIPLLLLKENEFADDD